MPSVLGPGRRRTGAWLLLLLGVVLLVARLSSPPRHPAADSRAPSVSRFGAGEAVAGVTTPRDEIGFRTIALLREHYRKHGREFGAISLREYLHRAQRLRDGHAGGRVLESVRADGVVTRFDRSSGAFLAFDRDGTIRTFFRPRQGEVYFRRQALRR